MGESGAALVSSAQMGGTHGTCRQRLFEALSKTQKVAPPTLSTVRPGLLVGGGTQSIVREMPGIARGIIHITGGVSPWLFVNAGQLSAASGLSPALPCGQGAAMD
jgi:hypothetical protein